MIVSLPILTQDCTHSMVIEQTPLMGGLEHSVQQRGAWAGKFPTQSPPSCENIIAHPLRMLCLKYWLLIFLYTGPLTARRKILCLNSRVQVESLRALEVRKSYGRVTQSAYRLKAISIKKVKTTECCRHVKHGHWQRILDERYLHLK